MKILLLGESNVGKTSLVTRYAHDKYDAQNNLLTVGIDIRKINKQLNGRHILLECIIILNKYGTQQVRRSTKQYLLNILKEYKVYYLFTI
jgi:GTPase SAR1 family protein